MNFEELYFLFLTLTVWWSWAPVSQTT